MPALKIVYFPIPGRAEPTRLTLAVGGHSFEDEKVTGEQWGATMKPKVAPKQLPLIYVDGECYGQSIAMLRYAGKISVDGKPLYPTCPLAALKVDEFIDITTDAKVPLVKTFAIEDPAEREAARAKLVTEDGEMTKWLRFIDELLGKSASGFAVGDSFTIADITAFTSLQSLRSGFLDGIPKDCLDCYKNICAHAVKIANIPQVKEYYKNAEGVHAVYKA
eukprot:TRINITY_DN10_c0_g1_i11.p1 TRINITY_DN10_c0_g1~~TRINITY_DN10_c0_g1_i11.p1  ORF type:complete len:239 (+),score=90.74 TRINITY_DN10_c0_g1_i11:58-717(+)